MSRSSGPAGRRLAPDAPTASPDGSVGGTDRGGSTAGRTSGPSGSRTREASGERESGASSPDSARKAAEPAILDRYSRGDRGKDGGLSSGRNPGSDSGDATADRGGRGSTPVAEGSGSRVRGSIAGDQPTRAGRSTPIDAPKSSGRDYLGRPSPSGRGRIGGIEHTEPLRDLAARNPRLAREVGDAGRVVSEGTRSSIEVGVSVALGCFGISAGYWDDDVWIGFWGGYNSCYSNYWYWWGCGGYPYSYYCHPFSYPYYCYYGYWPSVRYWYPDYYYPAYYSYPAYTASVITRYVYDDYYYDDGGEVYVDEGYTEDSGGAMQETDAEPAQGEGVALPAPAPSPAPAPGPDSVARATTQYLTLGDQAFRDGRFADAVHFYARAVQFAPEDGVVWLVLSDGLLATGDYHYGAYALRQALELDPTLAESPIDKHGFYTDGAEFDRQLAVLEGFVADHPENTDALLMLAANYLFGGRPAACVDLLGEPRAEAVRAEPAGAALLAAAEVAQYGD